MLFSCHSHGICIRTYYIYMYSYVIRMSVVCTLMSSVCYLYVLVCNGMSLVLYSYFIRMSLAFIHVSSVCDSYILACYPYITRMYLQFLRMSFVCTRMSSTCHSYVLVYHPYAILATTLIPILFIRIFLSSATRFGNLNNLKRAHIISCSHVQRSAWTIFFQVPNLSGGHFYLRPRWDCLTFS